MTHEPLMTIQDVCAYLKIGRTTFYRMVNEDDLPAFRIRGQLRVRPEQLRYWISIQEDAA